MWKRYLCVECTYVRPGRSPLLHSIGVPCACVLNLALATHLLPMRLANASKADRDPACQAKAFNAAAALQGSLRLHAGERLRGKGETGAIEGRENQDRLTRFVHDGG